MDTFVNLFVAAVLAGTPLLFGTLGEILNEKSGHLNLGVEGMMAMGACAGFMIGYVTDSFLMAILGAFAAGVFAALIYGILTVTFMANQNVTGLTLTIFGVGLSNFVGEFMLTKSETKSLKLPEHLQSQLKEIKIPVLSEIPVVGDLFFNYNIFVYIGIIVAVVCGIYLHRTRVGLNLRAVGENPGAADAAGISVNRYKYVNIMIGGGICGIGGAYASMIICNGVWISNCVNGLGWIAVALVIFATWSPYKAILGSLVFGVFSVLKYYVPKTLFRIPDSIFDMVPFIVTILVLIMTSIRQSRDNAQPQSCGTNYFREER